MSRKGQRIFSVSVVEDNPFFRPAVNVGSSVLIVAITTEPVSTEGVNAD
jgi:hypothetical protein